MELLRYDVSRKAAWDSFVDASKNGTFLLRRDYMDYHADRFKDHSLLVEDAGALLAAIPANEKDGVLVSHGGLTYGGVVAGDGMSACAMLAVFDALLAHMRSAGLRLLRYKAVPRLYHRLPADEDLYALFANGARLVKRDVSATILLSQRLPWRSSRVRGLKNARKAGLAVRESVDYAAFSAILADVLAAKGAKPVHSAEELALLAGRFPRNIRLFSAHRSDDGPMLGGVVIFETPWVAHTQYIAATLEGKDLGAVDFLVDHLLSQVYKDKRYFDLGTSMAPEGGLNPGLIDQKEMFGARACVYDTYELELKS